MASDFAVVPGCRRALAAEREMGVKARPEMPGPAERYCDFRKAEKHCARPPQKRQ